MTKSALLAIAGAACISGCSTLNEIAADRVETVEIYHIYDFKTKVDVAAISKAAANGLAQNTNSVQSASPLQFGKTIPEQPGRFVIADPGASMGPNATAFLKFAAQQNGGLVPREAICDNAVWTSKAVRQISGSNNLTLYSCLYRYRAGYQLDVYGVFTKISGGLGEPIRMGAAALAGTPEEWVNKTIVDTVRSIEAAAGTRASHVEGQPAIGPLPTADQLSQRR